MSLTLYNTLSHRLEPFSPLVEGEVGLYTCGPTVYDYAHIGNYRAYMFEDLLKRYLKFKGYKVKHIMNLTDVDDKTIKGSMREGLPLKDYTRKYIEAFYADKKLLNIEPADIYPPATEHIPEMLALITMLKDKGVTYESEGSTYFRISSFPDYGKLAGISAEGLKTGVRFDVDEYDKEEARDFALWKAYKPEDGEVWWDSPFGKGRPGWHIECSAMSMKYLGETFDIHCGGEDNIFPHHENEIAQSEAATGKPFVKYWLHCGYLLVEGRKMSKSLGNFYTLKDLVSRGYSPKAIRYILLATHYRQQLNFTLEGLESATNALKRVQDFIVVLNSIKKPGNGIEIDALINNARSEFTDSLDDDLNIAPALGAVFTFIREVNRVLAEGNLTSGGAGKALDLLLDFDKVLGLFDFSQPEADSEVEALIIQRNDARARKDWKASDDIRMRLTAMGIVLEDTKEGTRWKRI